MREGGREGEKEGGREGVREGGSEGGRERGREGEERRIVGWYSNAVCMEESVYNCYFVSP